MEQQQQPSVSEYLEETKRYLNNNFENTVRSDFITNTTIGSVGAKCNDCNYTVMFATKLNYLNSEDINGNEWARVNTVSTLAKHMVENPTL